MIEELVGGGREHVGGTRFPHVVTPIEQGGRRQRGEEGRIVERVPVGRASPIGERYLRIGVLHQRVPALQTRRAGDVQRDRVTIRSRERLHVPLRRRQRPACDVSGGDPMDQVGRVNGVLFQLIRAAVGMRIDNIARSERRQRTERI